MANADDPFTAIINATWAMLEASSGFTDIVKVGNRIKYDDDDPIKNAVSTVDKPEVRIIPTSLVPDGRSDSLLVGASNTSLMVFGMELQISTGIQRLDDASIPGRENVARVLWESIRATWAHQTHYVSMSWGDPAKDFKVHGFKATAASIGVLIDDLTRGISGFSALLSMEVSLNLAISVHE